MGFEYFDLTSILSIKIDFKKYKKNLETFAEKKAPQILANFRSKIEKKGDFLGFFKKCQNPRFGLF